MMRAILGRDVRIGDTIDAGRGHRGKVLKHLFDDSGGKHYELDTGHICFLSGDIIGLLHRPWPQTSSESELLDRILILARTAESIARIGKKEFDSHLGHLGTAMDAYELGKPLEPDGNESLVDRHMTP